MGGLGNRQAVPGELRRATHSYAFFKKLSKNPWVNRVREKRSVQMFWPIHPATELTTQLAPVSGVPALPAHSKILGCNSEATAMFFAKSSQNTHDPSTRPQQRIPMSTRY